MKMIYRIIFYILCLLALLYAIFVEPRTLDVVNYKIQEESLSGIKVVLIGDLHVKPNQAERLDAVIAKVNEQNPDLILGVGDYISGSDGKSSMPIEEMALHLSNLKSKYGIYTVLGNHDWWDDGNKITTELEKIGFKVLENSNTKVNINGKTIHIAGLADLNTRMANIGGALWETSNPVILLTHSPDVFPKIPNTVNLTLAGHTHGGQIRIPLIGGLVVPSKFGNRYSQGLVIEEDKKMIVTKGIGTSIFNIRFNCKPEIVVIEFE